jgi:hypothetical protein
MLRKYFFSMKILIKIKSPSVKTKGLEMFSSTGQTERFSNFFRSDETEKIHQKLKEVLYLGYLLNFIGFLQNYKASLSLGL